MAVGPSGRCSTRYAGPMNTRDGMSRKGGSIMSKFFTVAFRQQAEKQFGERQSTEVAKRAAAAARRQLQRLPLQLHHAFAHISEHFREQSGKPAHGVFLPQYQQPPELTQLLLRGT